VLRQRYLVSGLILLSGCVSGDTSYTPPADYAQNSQNSVVIARPFDDVWAKSVANLGKSFFVINNLEKSSGLINVSYSGNPEQYVDCGRAHIYVSNAKGRRDYDFNVASPQANYEIFENGVLWSHERSFGLEGRANIIFELLSEQATRVTVNTRYVLTESTTAAPVGGSRQVIPSQTISFNTGGGATAPNSRVRCVPTGEMEREILSSIR
jgi:hypothetical protein